MKPGSSVLNDAAVDEIVERVTFYKHHPKFRRAVVEAKNLVMHYLEDFNRDRASRCGQIVLGPHDQDLVERIACAIHVARIERGY